MRIDTARVDAARVSRAPSAAAPAEGRSRWRRNAACAALTIACVALPGCRRADIDLTVRGDGSGTVVVEVFPDAAVLERLDQVDLHFLIDEVTSSGDVEVTELGEGERRGYRVEVRFDEVDELSSALVSGGTVLGQRIQLFESFQLVELDGEWRLDAVINPIGTMTGDGPGDGPGDGLDELIDEARELTGLLTGRTGIELTIALPGEVTSSNGRTVDGGSVTWDLDELDAPTQLTMRSEPKEFPTTAQLVVGGGVALLVLGLFLTAWAAIRPKDSARSRRRREREVVFTAPVLPRSGWAPPTGAPVVPGPGSAAPGTQSGMPRAAGPRPPWAGPMPNPLPPLVDPSSADPDAAREASDAPGADPETPAWAGASEGDALDPDEVEPPVDPDEPGAGGRHIDLPAPEARPTVVRGSGMIMGREEPMIIEPLPSSVPEAGWYPDPAQEGRLRYWDGQAWTDRVG